ncbi:MAG: response regulator [Alphaproteobacteria bacterium]|nr:response regulator [Alphaproteobacteria bacterium]MCB9795926.1 response regulator [Alphaproteobacteria bacterium]
MQDAPLRVLVIDDDPDAWYLISAQLADVSRARYLADWEDEYGSGLARLLAREHDVALLDYRLGPRSGLELLDEARAQGFTGPIIVLTSMGDRRLDAEALELGADDFLIKGETTPDLLDHALRYAVDRARAREVLTTRSAQLARSNAALAEFAAAISHDLRAPLGALSSIVELVEDDAGLGQESRALLGRMRETLHRMDGLMADMLAYAGAGSTEGRAERVHLGAALDCALADLEPQLDASGAQVRVARLPEAWGWPRLVEQVFTNLISNAIKYSGDGPPRIDVRGERQADGLVSIEVTDEGPGIPEDRVEEVFTMFRRLSPSEDVPGVGIGLALCRRAVEAMGGQIQALPQAGRGACIRFTLPAEPPAPL